jgi:hypothetical protein
MNCINALCGQNAEVLFIKVGGTYSYHGAVRVKACSHAFKDL